jgi:hypothetical protein
MTTAEDAIAVLSMERCCNVGWIEQVVIKLSILRRSSNDLVIRPWPRTDYQVVESLLADVVLIADGTIHPTFPGVKILHGV